MAADGQRQQVRLGGVPKKTANTIKARIESLAAAQLARHAPDPETSTWLGDIESVLYDKLAAVGLVPEREARGGAKCGAQSGAQAAQNAAQPMPASSRQSCQERQKALADKGLWPNVADDGGTGQMYILSSKGVERRKP